MTVIDTEIKEKYDSSFVLHDGNIFFIDDKGAEEGECISKLDL